MKKILRNERIIRLMSLPSPAEQTWFSISYSLDKGFPGRWLLSCETELDTEEYKLPSLFITSIICLYESEKDDSLVENKIEINFSFRPCAKIVFWISLLHTVTRKFFIQVKLCLRIKVKIGNRFEKQEIKWFNSAFNVKSYCKCASYKIQLKWIKENLN